MPHPPRTSIRQRSATPLNGGFALLLLFAGLAAAWWWRHDSAPPTREDTLLLSSLGASLQTFLFEPLLFTGAAFLYRFLSVPAVLLFYLAQMTDKALLSDAVNILLSPAAGVFLRCVGKAVFVVPFVLWLSSAAERPGRGAYALVTVVLLMVCPFGEALSTVPASVLVSAGAVFGVLAIGRAEGDSFSALRAVCAAVAMAARPEGCAVLWVYAVRHVRGGGIWREALLAVGLALLFSVDLAWFPVRAALDLERGVSMDVFSPVPGAWRGFPALFPGPAALGAVLAVLSGLMLLRDGDGDERVVALALGAFLIMSPVPLVSVCLMGPLLAHGAASEAARWFSRFAGRTNGFSRGGR